VTFDLNGGVVDAEAGFESVPGLFDDVLRVVQGG
jgi:hypothetical protein